jgi:ATP-dependent Clp protease protease subunit
MSNRTENTFAATLIERRGQGGQGVSIFSLLLEERIVFLGAPIEDSTANNVVAALLWLQREDPEKEISIYINSPGGTVTAGLAIYDTMQLVSAPISTVAVGMTASMGTILLCAGTKGRRYALPNATIHIHQPWGGVQGQAVDIEIEARRILRERERLNQILSKHTGQPLERIVQDTDRNYWMSAEQAVQYGIIDEVLQKTRPADNGVSPSVGQDKKG